MSKKPIPPGRLPTVNVALNSIEIGFLVGVVIREGEPVDPVARHLARQLYRKLKAGAIEGGVPWVYGDLSWDVDL